ncbi:MAG: inositol monophosphatase family protein [Patescibacteria group bacterium]
MIPKDFSLYFGNPMLTVMQAVYEAAGAIQNLSREAVVKDGEGHRSIVSKPDVVSQKTIADICSSISGIKILGEEDSDDPLFLSRANPEGIFEGTRLVVDPIDGTVPLSHKLGYWSIGAGLVQDGEIDAGIVIAPATENGVGVAAENGSGAYLIEDSGISPITPQQRCEPKKSVVLLGVDTLLYQNITALVPSIAMNVRALYTTGSGLWGLMMVAAGRAGAVIQTPQKAWDWVPAYRAILESGRIFRFFRIENGTLAYVEKPDLRSFCYASENRLGFVAGIPELSDRLFDLLSRAKNWERINPETATGTW